MAELKQMLRGVLAPAAEKKTVLDSVHEDGEILDAATATATDIALSAAAAVQEWALTPNEDLDDGETNADRLMAMLVGTVDANKDGELDDDEQELVNEALNASFDYLTKLGVPEDDAADLLNDWGVDVADRVKDLVASSMPEGEAADADIDAFVFGDDDQAATFDAAYRKVFAVRRGKKVRISKRISGTVRLSSKQKVAIRKARMKSHSAKAKIRRLKSVRLRGKVGLNK